MTDLIKCFKDLLKMLLRNANAIIFDRDEQIALNLADFQQNQAFFAEFESVGQQV